MTLCSTKHTSLVLTVYLLLLSAPLGADSADQRTLQEPPSYGIYYERPEPAFYTGFAPRALDPQRLHLHLGRGNQLRATVVLSDAVLAGYARDLLHRYTTYRSLIDQEHLVLTQNRAFEEFEKTIQDLDLERLVSEEASLSPHELRERNLQLLERLNPGRVFRIRMSADDVLRRWLGTLRPEDRVRMNRGRQLELLNLMLPTRLFIAELDSETSAALEALIGLSPTAEEIAEPGDLDRVRPAFFQLLDRVTDGIYPVRDDSLQFDEFTAIYPIGSFNEYTNYHGRQIPMYPTPGRRALTTHQRTKTVEHIPTKIDYSYFPWIPYMHVGDRLHNSFHTLWWRMTPDKTAFLPPSWHSSEGKSRNGKPYPYLWLLSRGPMSHGCTHVNAGHISELRQLLPPQTERLYEVDTFLNKSHLYDVFDIDGDLEPEVMGVRYFIAYSLRNKRPHRLRAPNERHAFYDWLYGGELEYDQQDRGFFSQAKDSRFVGRKAIDGREYENIALYEAQYEPEKIQFYHLVDIPFARALRKVSVHHPMPLPGTQTSADH